MDKINAPLREPRKVLISEDGKTAEIWREGFIFHVPLGFDFWDRLSAMRRGESVTGNCLGCGARGVEVFPIEPYPGAEGYWLCRLCLPGWNKIHALDRSGS